MTPEEALRAGQKMLNPVLEAYGFGYFNNLAGKGSGGIYVAANWLNLGIN